MEIRLATVNDEIAVCRLWSMLLRFYQKKTAMEVLQQSYRYAVAHPLQILVYIILVEGVVTGTASLHLGHYSTWNDNWYGHIEDVIIDPDYRGRGLASNLICHLITAAGEQNLSRLELSALNENYAARKMYEKFGFTTDSVTYELHLDN